MLELKLPRLLAAAKEFNVGQDTIVDFLVGKGFSRDDLKPTAKLSEDMYRSLQHQFQGDKVAKNKADLVDIPKGVQQESRKKRDEQEITFNKKEIPKPVAQQPTPEVAPVAVTETKGTEQNQEVKQQVQEEVKPQAPAAAVSQPTTKPVADAPKTEAAVEKTIEPAPAAPVQEPATSVAPSDIPVEEPRSSNNNVSPTSLKIEAPELEGPKVIAKIDLSAIDSSTRPKKGSKKTEDKKAEDKKAKEQPIADGAGDQGKAEPVEQAAPFVAAPIAVPTPQLQPEPVELLQPLAPAASFDGPVISNIKADKLEGPKILGKIQLPVESDTRPKPQTAQEKQRKRKRIPVKGEQAISPQARPGQPQGQTQSTGPNNRFGPRSSELPGAQRPPAGGQGGYGRPGGAPSAGGGFNRPGGPGGQNRPPAAGGQNANRFGPRSTDKRRDDKEIDQKEIQDKIRETQAKLAGGAGRGKSLKAKYRKAKRDGVADQLGPEGDDNKLLVTEFISVSELANLMDVSFAEVIGKCMGLGIMVSINQRLDAEVIELVAGEFGFDVEFIDMEAQAEMEEEDDVDDEDNLVPRAPIVTIMGHVDHGKTSLLDYIRSANVVAGEAGGITQHIGAYEVKTTSGKKITFLDTPGHEAFTAMRARGAKVTDISVIVVAADDAVMPQTREAISHSQAASVPMIFAINKIDKDGANPQKIYEQLSGMNILVEEWGGKYQSQELSAKKGQNVDLLLEKILLEAEILDLKANPDREASGTIVEATLDKGRGYVATLLVQNGTLRQGDIMVSGQHFGKIKAMFNERNQRLTEAPPSTPVLVLGLNGAPQAGEKFRVYQDEAEAKDIATKRAQILREQGLRARKHITLDEIGRRLALGNFKELNLIIKGDVDGSVEALSDSLQKLSTEEIAVRVVHKGVGQISESDVNLATASDAILIGFNVRPSSQAARVAENEGLEIKLYSIIYQAIDELKSAMEGMLEPKFTEKITANVEVREVYKFDKATVAGCLVLDGKIFRNSKVRIIRDGIVEFPKGEGAAAELGSLKRFKDDVKEVANNMECGLTIKNYNDLRVGDIIEAFESEEVKRTL
ncbi:translation initiation factor IF-2 [Segetibacter aerophilus]|uniref:Translation initiation factor IF-2 n=1 Tax=Segetibacter aerophilus TaxID=670293 RepID=A0A512BCN8_9BACT|nr:translation initiation factor IF-2 [Segetibacter aerophilus]GEO09708.1 translation initiation factor IF-2 [Segetibacter aerophilus]